MSPKSQPFSIRLGEHADLLVRDEVRRSGRSRSAVVEDLAEEAAKTRLFPGVAFRGSPRRARVIGTGLDVWEILELLRSYAGDEQRLQAAHPLLGERHVRLARAYGERFPDEVAAFVEEITRPLDELRRLYPFLQFGEYTPGVRLLLDAHVSGPNVGRRLEESGRDVRALDLEPALEGLDDDEVLALAAAENRILVTHNVADFPRILREWAAAERAHAGVILVYGIDHSASALIVRGIERWLGLHSDRADWRDLPAVLDRRFASG